MLVVIKHSLCTKKIILSLILSRPQLQKELDEFLKTPAGPDADNCLAQLPSILAKVKQFANAYKQVNSTSLEFVKFAECPENRQGGFLYADEHNASMATFGARITEIDPEFKRAVYATRRVAPQEGWEAVEKEETHAAILDRGHQRGNKQKKHGQNKRPATFEHKCTVVGCSGKADAEGTRYITDENNKRKGNFQDPYSPPRLLNYICKTCWDKRSVVTLTNGLEMDMKAINERRDASKTPKGKGKRSGKGKGGRGGKGGRKESAYIASNEIAGGTFEESEHLSDDFIRGDPTGSCDYSSR